MISPCRMLFTDLISVQHDGPSTSYMSVGSDTNQWSCMVDPLHYFSFQPVLHDWSNKDRGMCYPVCGMMHIKEPLLLIGNISLCSGGSYLSGPLPESNKGPGMCYPVCGMMHIKESFLVIGKNPFCGSGFPLSLSEWSFTICPTPYNRK